MSELPETVKALLDPKAYPDSHSKIDMVQTQMSFIFLTDDLVYKVKKPVNLGYLDYTTLDKRQFYCQREVELNQRLCPQAYLDTVPITRQKDGIFIGGKGDVIDYAVKMRRLPKERMMNTLLTSNQVSPDMVVRVAQKLADFHRKAETSEDISNFGNLDTIRQNTEENFTQAEKYIGSTISAREYQLIKAYTNSFVEKNAPLFQRRVTTGKIKDCHGDLHAAHICFTDSICIYDCIEFNDRFRYCDVASEIAFLAMDLDHYERKDLSHSFINAYINSSRDAELAKLLNFYKCYRAYVRGKVESFKSDDPYISSGERAEVTATARSYFNLAESYT